MIFLRAIMQQHTENKQNITNINSKCVGKLEEFNTFVINFNQTGSHRLADLKECTSDSLCAS
jgi:hypothetical protein